MRELTIHPKPFQDKFLFSEKRFPALIAGIGTGKTMMLLLKIFRFCEEYPDSLALIVRKEYTDLKDSTIKDFERYFNVIVGSDKDYKLPNNSIIMFRHGAELNVLKNINLSIGGIEQAEEFDTEETFNFIRDRLRRDNAPYRQLCIIGNTKGHNWIWRIWKNNPQSEEYVLSQANTFMNADNLPEDFINDLKAMELEAPNHYKQYVLNDWEEIDADDYLFNWEMLNKSNSLSLTGSPTKKILSLDVARFGDDESVFTIIENKGSLWEQTFIEAHHGKDLMWQVGRFIDLRREFKTQIGVIDDVGVGGGAVDRLKEFNINIERFIASEKAKQEELFANKTAENYFKLKDMIEKGYLQVMNNHALLDQLLTIRYKYTSKGQKAIISKDEMRKNGIKSPDMADALMMAVSCVYKLGVKKDFIPETKRVY